MTTSSNITLSIAEIIAFLIAGIGYAYVFGRWNTKIEESTKSNAKDNLEHKEDIKELYAIVEAHTKSLEEGKGNFKRLNEIAEFRGNEIISMKQGCAVHNQEIAAIKLEQASYIAETKNVKELLKETMASVKDMQKVLLDISVRFEKFESYTQGLKDKEKQK